MVMGWDDALIMGAITAAGAAASASTARANNRANSQMNAFNEAQAWAMYHDTHAWEDQNSDLDRRYNSAEALAAREFSADESTRARQFNAQQVAGSQAWEKQMSDTSYQRAVGDMKSAGLNPMLAYSQGGASTPSSPAGTSPIGGTSTAHSQSASGSSASVPSKIPMQNENGLASALQASKVGIDLMRQESEIKNIDSQTAKNNADAARTGTETKYNTESFDERIRSLKLDTGMKDLEHKIGRELEEVTEGKARADWLYRKNQIDQQQYEKRIKEANAQLDELGVPKAKAYSEYYKGPAGKAEPYIGLGADVLTSASGAFRNLMSGKQMGKGRSYSETMYDRHGNPSGGRSRDYQDD